MDTPISESDCADELNQHFVELKRQKTEGDISERFERTEIFLKYLKEREEAEVTSRPEYQFSDLTRKRFLEEIIKSYEQRKEYILSHRKHTE